ncbi:glycosyltransferase [Sphingomonas sp. RB3P16]|uniref:glycosyltransferase n=1 Tax=Parasphingomonas frigoris TaxID=3096163 RepID=UPI003FA70E45
MIRSGAPRLAYFVHDVADAAVARRVGMLHAAGVVVTVIGFRRRAVPLDTIDGARVVDLGQTGDGRFVQRIWAVLRNLAAFDTVRRAVSDADVLMARNLETLVLAARAAKGRRLVYECLDIHRMLLTDGLLPGLVQRVERAALRKVALIVTSSPRFADAYFRDRRGVATPVLLVENKLPMLTDPPAARSAVGAVAGPPWVVGWFGMLRCKRSLAILAELAAASNGRVEVLIAGIPSDAEFSDFAETVAAMPGVTFVGRYQAGDLAALYGRVHFAWAIDFFEEGLNSTWLLPNRLYESLGYGAVPIALATVETGAWLKRNHVGLVIDTAEEAAAHLQSMSIPKYGELAAAVAALPRATIELTAEENAAIVATIVGN